MKHNKKRNTAFLYECLIRELTKAIVRENVEKQTKVKDLLREFFTKGKTLSEDLNLYNDLMQTKCQDPVKAKRFIFETKKDWESLDRKTSLMNKQS